MNDTGEDGNNKLEPCSICHHHRSKMKPTANKTPNPAVAFWVNHSWSLRLSLPTTLHLCSFILCWEAEWVWLQCSHYSWTTSTIVTNQSRWHFHHLFTGDVMLLTALHVNLRWPHHLCDVYVDSYVCFMLRSPPFSPRLTSSIPLLPHSTCFHAIVLEIILSSSSPAGSPSSPK